METLNLVTEVKKKSASVEINPSEELRTKAFKK